MTISGIPQYDLAFIVIAVVYEFIITTKKK